MFIIDIYAVCAADVVEYAAILQDNMVSGLFLFSYNYLADQDDAFEHLCLMIDAIKKIRPDLLIFVDHEGGTTFDASKPNSKNSAVWRFDDAKHFPLIPPARHFGLIAESAGISSAMAAQKTAMSKLLKPLAELGITPAGPVADSHDERSAIITGLNRSFSKDPEIQLALLGSDIESRHQYGLPAVIKHWPDHGATFQDSHIDQQTIYQGDDKLLQRQIDLYVALIQSGHLGENDFVMSNHVMYPRQDKASIAGASKYWMNLLRDELGFCGRIVSDCLSMKGAHDLLPDDRGLLPTQAIAALAKRMAEHDGSRLNDLLILTHLENFYPDQTRPFSRQQHIEVIQNIIADMTALVCHERPLRSEDKPLISPS
jgi:beta-N-acetylhexosaminidase